MKVIYTRKKQEIFVDDEDFEFLNQWTWYITGDGYVTRHTPMKNGIRSKIMMHRQIFDIIDNDVFVDHINHIKHDNQKINLRMCTTIENRRNNKSKGYSFDKKLNMWQAYISIDKKQIRIGYFATEDEAKEHRKLAEIKHYGEFANQTKYV